MIALDSIEIVDKDLINVSWFENGNHWQTWDSNDLFNHIIDLNDEIERLNDALKEYDRGTYCKLINENRKLNTIINELEKCIKNKYYEAVDYQTKIRQSDLMQGDYPVSYYLSEQNEQLCNYFLSRLKDLQQLKGSESNDKQK